jgi:hypothetical protein
MVGSGAHDPKSKNNWKQSGTSALNQTNLSKLDIDGPIKEIPSSAFEVDDSLDEFFQEFCKCIVEEAANPPKELESFVDHYGKEL